MTSKHEKRISFIIKEMLMKTTVESLVIHFRVLPTFFSYLIISSVGENVGE